MRLAGEVTVAILFFACWVWLARRLSTIEELIEKMGFAIMAQVSIEQDDLDAVGASLEALVDVVKQIDTSSLPPADKTKLAEGLTDLTAAINDKLTPSTPVEPPADGDV